MTEKARLHCLSCGYDFETEVLTTSEKEEYRRQFRRWGLVHCPHCNRTDIRREEMRRTG